MKITNISDSDFKRKKTREDFGWYRRGYLPHFDGGSELPQFITFRLSDSMPRNVLDKWLRQGISDVEFRKKIEAYLDSGVGACWLKNEAVANIVSDALRFPRRPEI